MKVTSIAGCNQTITKSRMKKCRASKTTKH